MNEHGRTWRVGELARATGVTVRALHHYDAIGLLRPSVRAAGGQRRYTGTDVRRLHAIHALRGFGVPLAGIAGLLDAPGTDPRDVLRWQLAQVDERIAAAYRLRAGLRAVLDALDRAVEPSVPTVVRLIEEMTAMDRRLTPEELEEMTANRRRWRDSLTPEQIEDMNRQRTERMAELPPEELAEMSRRRAALWPDPGAPRAEP